MPSNPRTQETEAQGSQIQDHCELPSQSFFSLSLYLHRGLLLFCCSKVHWLHLKSKRRIFDATIFHTLPHLHWDLISALNVPARICLAIESAEDFLSLGMHLPSCWTTGQVWHKKVSCNPLTLSENSLPFSDSPRHWNALGEKFHRP